MTLKIRTATLLAATLTLLAGCGTPTKKMVTVTGTVSYKGQQLKAGVVKFIAPDGGTGVAVIGTDGKFIMTDVVPGEQKVAVVAGPMGSGSSDKGTAGGDAPTSRAVSLPAQFGDPQTAGVTVTVPEKGGEVTVELK
jgi:hypothetical protein